MYESGEREEGRGRGKGKGKVNTENGEEKEGKKGPGFEEQKEGLQYKSYNRLFLLGVRFPFL